MAKHWETFKELKERMKDAAFNRNNNALLHALRFCKTIEDVKTCINQAHGKGSETFRKDFAWVLNLNDSDLAIDLSGIELENHLFGQD